jgi:hypothetical protein
MQQSGSGNYSWKDLLASPARASHILQLYDSQDFLANAVAHFAAEGLTRGEAVLLTGTKEHLGDIRRELRLADVDADAAVRSGQLTLSDVHESLAAVVPQGTLEQALGDPRFGGVRWWGEISNTLYHRGEREACLRAEKLGDAAAKKYGATLFCSFLCDKYDARGYDRGLKDMCCVHSHVIPAEDYVRHRLAVNYAIADVIGELKGSLLQSLASWEGVTCSLPSSQALLFWLRETLPERFEAVLKRARHYETKDGS